MGTKNAQAEIVKDTHERDRRQPTGIGGSHACGVQIAAQAAFQAGPVHVDGERDIVKRSSQIRVVAMRKGGLRRLDRRVVAQIGWNITRRQRRERHAEQNAL